MLIDAYIVCWNEEKLLPFTLDYYSSFCDTIHLLDNHSSDDSLKIAATYPKVKVTQWQCEEGPDVYDDRSTTIIKSFAYEDLNKGADWVCIVDCDEFLYHPRIREKLEEYMYAGITLPRTRGYEMISKEFPVSGIPLTEQIKTGVYEPGMSKRAVFDPRISLKYKCGAHEGSVQPTFGMIDKNASSSEKNIPLPYTSTLKPVESPEEEVLYGDMIKVLHYKDLSPQYKIGRLKRLAARLSSWSLDTETCAHWLQTEGEINSYFERRVLEASDVI